MIPDQAAPAAQQWAQDLAGWAIPAEILEQAPESPWIHPVELFVVDAEVPDSPSHARARDALPAGGTVLDVGCGGGRAAMALADRAGLLVGVDSSPAMLERFSAAAASRGIAHEEIVGGWPEVQAQAPLADVVVCHHVAYNVAALAPFLQALGAHARRRVVLELPWVHPLSSMSPLWERFWGVRRPTAPTAQDALAVAREAGLPATLDVWDDVDGRAAVPPADQARFMRIRLCLPPEREPEVAQALAELGPPGPRRTATLWWDV